MANVRDSDTSLWLHNKLGTSNDSWISGSICSQLNKEVLRNIKECFPDLQTQVKLKLLLSFFHIPRRLVEEWKSELEEVIEVAGLDTELWVSMLAESMKTFPASSSLNIEISDYEDTRPIFTDMVNDLRKLVSKHSDLGMLPLECQYLNKNALISVVGQQANPIKHFTIKRKPKSVTLRTELLHKSAEAQSSLKKASAPTIPLRSRGMPRKMTDTTPLKGIPSRMPTSGFRSSNTNSTNQQRPNLSRTSAGRKDGGIKLIEFMEQPLGYAAAKKRKREQQLEEQAKKQEQKAAAAAAVSVTSDSNGATLNNTSVNTGTILNTSTNSINNSFEIKSEPTILNQSQSNSADEGGSISDSKEDGKSNINSVIGNKSSEQILTTTPEYAPPSLSYIQTTSSALIDNISDITIDDTKPITQTLIGNLKSDQSNTTLNTITTVGNITNKNVNHKRIKQEIEIKKEEIIVPANIKVEKLDISPKQTSTQTLLRIQQQKSPQQRVIVQQQQTFSGIPQVTTQNNQQHTVAQHLIIRTSPKGQKQTLTLRQENTSATTVKMEKLQIKPLTRHTHLTQQGNILNAQQQSVSVSNNSTNTTNPLVHLPNNISVKITKTGKNTQLQQHVMQQVQTQVPQKHQQILINSNTPVILASNSTHAAALKTNQLTSGTVSVQNMVSQTAQSIKSMPLSQLKSATNSGPVIISQTIIQPAKRPNNAGLTSQQQISSQSQSSPTQQTHIISSQAVQQQQQQQQQQPTSTTQYILTQTQPIQNQQQQSTLTAYSTYTPTRQQPTLTTFQTSPSSSQASSPTKILLKTSTPGMMLRQNLQSSPQAVGNPPPLIATSSPTGPTLLNIQNVQLPNRQVTIQPASQAAQQQHLQAQLQQQQHTLVSNNTATQQPKLTQVLMQPSSSTGTNTLTAQTNHSNANLKNKTIILTQKGVILRNIVGDMYEQIPISNVSGLQALSTGNGTTTLMTSAAGPSNIVKTSTATALTQPQTITIQQPQLPSQSQISKTQLPTLMPTQQHMIVQQQPHLITNQPAQQTIIRPVMTNVQSGLSALPTGLTLIQRPGQQPQLVQMQTTSVQQNTQSAQIQRTIITQPAIQQQQTIQGQSQLRTQQIVLQHKPTTQRLIAATPTSVTAASDGQKIQLQQTNTGGIQRIIQLSPQQQQATQSQQQRQQSQQSNPAPQRKGLSLSNEHVHKAHEMFRKANRVSRPDKALILGFMAGLRENPRPNSENVIIIKLGETEEKVQQDDGNTVLCLVESHIRLDYNTGEWKTFQNYRRLDQNLSQSSGDGSTNVIQQTANTVAI